MSGTKEGAQKTKAKNLAKNPNHFKDMGRIGGHNSSGYEFAHGKFSPVEAGRRGGTISKRKAKNES